MSIDKLLRILNDIKYHIELHDFENLDELIYIISRNHNLTEASTKKLIQYIWEDMI